jgi:hypothetical protein
MIGLQLLGCADQASPAAHNSSWLIASWVVCGHCIRPVKDFGEIHHDVLRMQGKFLVKRIAGLEIWTCGLIAAPNQVGEPTASTRNWNPRSDAVGGAVGHPYLGAPSSMPPTNSPSKRWAWVLSDAAWSIWPHSGILMSSLSGTDSTTVACPSVVADGEYRKSCSSAG